MIGKRRHEKGSEIDAEFDFPAAPAEHWITAGHHDPGPGPGKSLAGHCC